MQKELRDLIAAVGEAFGRLREGCPHRVDTDCGHPDIDFNCVVCAPCNCPVLES